jgi:hypothetical protein
MTGGRKSEETKQEKTDNNPRRNDILEINSKFTIIHLDFHKKESSKTWLLVSFVSVLHFLFPPTSIPHSIHFFSTYFQISSSHPEDVVRSYSPSLYNEHLNNSEIG